MRGNIPLDVYEYNQNVGDFIWICAWRHKHSANCIKKTREKNRKENQSILGMLGNDCINLMGNDGNDESDNDSSDNSSSSDSSDSSSSDSSSSESSTESSSSDSCDTKKKKKRKSKSKHKRKHKSKSKRKHNKKHKKESRKKDKRKHKKSKSKSKSKGVKKSKNKNKEKKLGDSLKKNKKNAINTMDIYYNHLGNARLKKKIVMPDSTFPADIGNLGVLDRNIKECFDKQKVKNKTKKKPKKTLNNDNNSSDDFCDLSLQNKQSMLDFNKKYKKKSKSIVKNKTAKNTNNNNNNSINDNNNNSINNNNNNSMEPKENEDMDVEMGTSAAILGNEINYDSTPRSCVRGRGLSLNEKKKPKRDLATMQVDSQLPVNPKEFLEYRAKLDNECFEDTQPNAKRRKKIPTRTPNWSDSDKNKNTVLNNNNNSSNIVNESGENKDKKKNNAKAFHKNNSKYCALPLYLADNGITTITNNLAVSDLYASDEFNHILSQSNNDNNNNSKSKKNVKKGGNDTAMNDLCISNSDDMCCADLMTPGGPGAVVGVSVNVSAGDVGAGGAAGKSDSKKDQKTKQKSGKGRPKKNYQKINV